MTPSTIREGFLIHRENYPLRRKHKVRDSGNSSAPSTSDVPAVGAAPGDDKLGLAIGAAVRGAASQGKLPWPGHRSSSANCTNVPASALLVLATPA